MSATATPTLPAPAITPPPIGAGPKPWRWTVEQYYELGRHGFFDGKRVELIRGEIVEMSPINWPHVVGTSKTGEALRAAFSGAGTVIEQGPFPVAGSDLIPDVQVIPGSLCGHTSHPRIALLIVEVSDTTLFYDTTTKAELYATAGVPEYWVLDLTNRVLLVHRDPQPLPAGLGATAYRTHLVLSPTDQVQPLAAPAATVPVADLLP